MAELSTSQIRDLRDAAERARAARADFYDSPGCDRQKAEVWASARDEYRMKVFDPTTVKALCTELLVTKAVFQNRANLVQAGDRLIIEFRTSGEAVAAYELITKMERST